MMKIVLLLLGAAIFLPIQVYAQIQETTACDSQSSSISALIEQVSSNVSLECATEKVVAIVFDETHSKWGWTAIDALAEAGYTLSDVTASGIGSPGNPTRLFAILTK